MLALAASTVLLLLTLATTAPTDNHKPPSSCAKGVHMIVARASTEAPGEGVIGAVAASIAQQIPGSDAVAVDYPATLTNYTSSESQGVAAMTQLVQAHVASCPRSKIVLLGYSQGAQVVFDTLCGTSEVGFAATAALGERLGKNSELLPLVRGRE